MKEEHSEKIAQIFGLELLEKEDMIELGAVTDEELENGYLNWEGSTFTLKDEKNAEELKKFNIQLEEQIETLSIKKANIYKDDVLSSKIAVISTDTVFFYLIMISNPVTNDSYIIVEGPFNPHEAGLKYGMRLNEFHKSGCKIEELKDFNDMTIIEDEEK